VAVGLLSRHTTVLWSGKNSRHYSCWAMVVHLSKTPQKNIPVGPAV